MSNKKVLFVKCIFTQGIPAIYFVGKDTGAIIVHAKKIHGENNYAALSRLSEEQMREVPDLLELDQSIKFVQSGQPSVQLKKKFNGF